MTVVYYESEITSPTVGYGIAYFEPWNLYEGRLTGQEADNLTRIAEETAECVSAFGSNYVLLSVPEYKTEQYAYSGWRIDLDTMTAIGVTNVGNVVFAAEKQSPSVICIYDCESGELRCMLRADIHENGVKGLNLESFEVHMDSQAFEKQTTLEELWLVHVSEEEYPEFYPVLDGEWEYYCIRMVHEECAALQYELNYGVCNGKPFIENLRMGTLVWIPRIPEAE